MKVDKKTQELVESLTPEIRSRLAEYGGELEDVVQDCYVRIMESEIGEKENPEGFVRRLVTNHVSNYVRNERNRRRLEQDNSDEIISGATPTLSDRSTGGVDEFVEAQQIVARRWKTLSPLLRRIARLSFFGYEESPEKIAHDLGTTPAAINTARTRIKQHMNGANE